MRARIISRFTLRPGGRPGFSMIEMLVVLFALGVVMMLGTATLVGGLRMVEAATAACDQQILKSVLADDFRADVAQAAAAPARVEEWTADKTCLILRRTDGSHIVYRWQKNQLERSELAGSKVSRRRFPLGRASAAIEFSRAGDDGRLVTLRLSESWGSGTRKRSIEFAAALGGDLR